MKVLIKKTSPQKENKNVSNIDLSDIKHLGNHLACEQMVHDKKSIKDHINLSKNALEYFGWAAIK